MDDPVRIDKWLWAARLVKTRAQAADAVKGGLVQLGGQRTKPSKEIRVGDEVELTLHEVRRVLVVRALSDRRGPAPVAAQLYEETPASVQERERRAQERRLAAQPRGGARPTKRDRRRLDAAMRPRRGRD